MAKRQEGRGKDRARAEGGKHAAAAAPDAARQAGDVPVWYQPESGVPRPEEAPEDRPLSDDD
jgi:hypothetical protein